MQDNVVPLRDAGEGPADRDIFVDLDDTYDFDLGDGYSAKLREAIDWETEERLDTSLAPITIDLETQQPKIGQVDIAATRLALLRAYLVSIRRPDGTDVPVDRPGRIRPKWGKEIARHLQEKREAAQRGKGS